MQLHVKLELVSLEETPAAPETLKLLDASMSLEVGAKVTLTLELLATDLNQ